jgi:hypothetical protein
MNWRFSPICEDAPTEPLEPIAPRPVELTAWQDLKPASDDINAWLERHANPAWVFKAPTIPKLGKAKGAGKDREFRELIRQYQYAVTETDDRRDIQRDGWGSIFTLEEWIAQKTVARAAAGKTFKPYKLPARKTVLTKLSTAQRSAESQRIAAYVGSRAA